MPFRICMGVPEMEYYWKDLEVREAAGELSKGELKAFKKLIKTFNHLSIDPKYPGLCSHEIKPLSKIAGFKIWESYIENHTPSAGRIFWAYGPDKKDISILGFEPHPEDKKKTGYKKVKLSDLPQLGEVFNHDPKDFIHFESHSENYSSRKGKKLYWYCSECKRVITNNQVKGTTEPAVKDYHLMNCIKNHKKFQYRMYL